MVDALPRIPTPVRAAVSVSVFVAALMTALGGCVQVERGPGVRPVDNGNSGTMTSGSLADTAVAALPSIDTAGPWSFNTWALHTTTPEDVREWCQSNNLADPQVHGGASHTLTILSASATQPTEMPASTVVIPAHWSAYFEQVEVLAHFDRAIEWRDPDVAQPPAPPTLRAIEVVGRMRPMSAATAMNPWLSVSPWTGFAFTSYDCFYPQGRYFVVLAARDRNLYIGNHVGGSSLVLTDDFDGFLDLCGVAPASNRRVPNNPRGYAAGRNNWQLQGAADWSSTRQLGARDFFPPDPMESERAGDSTASAGWQSFLTPYANDLTYRVFVDEFLERLNGAPAGSTLQSVLAAAGDGAAIENGATDNTGSDASNTANTANTANETANANQPGNNDTVNVPNNANSTDNAGNTGDTGNNAAAENNDPPLPRDTTHPTIELLAPLGGETFGVRDTITVRWHCSDDNPLPERCITILITTTFRGAATAWQQLIMPDEPAAEMLPGRVHKHPNTGEFVWSPPSLEPSAYYRVMLLAHDAADNMAEAMSGTEFVVEAAPTATTPLPLVRLGNLPRLSTSAVVEIGYTLDVAEGAPPVTAVLAWARRVGGAVDRPWTRVAEVRGVVARQGTIRADLGAVGGDGRFEIALTCIDADGRNSDASGGQSLTPMGSVAIDTRTPTVALQSHNDGRTCYVAVASEIRWTCPDTDLPDAPVHIFLGLPADGGGAPVWTEITPPSGVPNNGRFGWTPGSGDVAGAALIRVDVRDVGGLAGRAQSARPFEIVRLQPEVTFTTPVPQTLRGTTLPLAIEVTQSGKPYPVSITTITIWTRRVEFDGTASPWRATTFELGEEPVFDISDYEDQLGLFNLYVTVTDEFGNTIAPPDEDTDAHMINVTPE